MAEDKEYDIKPGQSYKDSTGGVLHHREGQGRHGDLQKRMRDICKRKEVCPDSGFEEMGRIPVKEEKEND